MLYNNKNKRRYGGFSLRFSRAQMTSLLQDYSRSYTFFWQSMLDNRQIRAEFKLPNVDSKVDHKFWSGIFIRITYLKVSFYEIKNNKTIKGL